jgi:hypothetical protein
MASMRPCVFGRGKVWVIFVADVREQNGGCEEGSTCFKCLSTLQLQGVSVTVSGWQEFAYSKLVRVGSAKASQDFREMRAAWAVVESAARCRLF